MFKKIMLVFLVMVMAVPTVSYAAKDPNRVTVFNRVGDWLATVGKKDHNKKAILNRRKNNRRETREFKARQKKSKAIQDKMASQNKAILDKIHVRRTPHGR